MHQVSTTVRQQSSSCPKKKAEELGIKPLANILNWASAGVEPAIMGTGPVPAVRKVLDKLDMTIDQMDLIELNEAFAAQSVYCARELGVDMNKPTFTAVPLP